MFSPSTRSPFNWNKKGNFTIQISKHNKVIMLLWSHMSKHSLKTLLFLLLMKILNNILDLSFWAPLPLLLQNYVESLCVISSSPHNCYRWSLMRWLSIPQHIKSKTHTNPSLNFNRRILLISLMMIINSRK